MAEATNYVYPFEEVAKAFARDKWGQENPRMAVEVAPENGTDWKSDGTGFRDTE